MKRSDMVNIIEYYGLPVEVLQKAGINTLQLADNILKLIEEQGMLPPTIRVNTNIYMRSDHEYGWDENIWEEENEKNND